MKREPLLIAGWEDADEVTIGKYGAVTNTEWMWREQIRLADLGIDTDVRHRRSGVKPTAGRSETKQVALFYSHFADTPFGIQDAVREIKRRAKNKTDAVLSTERV